MLQNVYIFKRYEKKYRISEAQREALLRETEGHLIPDSHGKSRLHSIYLDTADYRLIRESITAGAYKEKLRLRSYGLPEGNDNVFFEIKKKYKGIVYKRRILLPLDSAYNYIAGGPPPQKGQIMNEIDYAMRVYGSLSPKMQISCDREAYFAADDGDVRLTFDSELRFLPNPEGFGGEGEEIIPDTELILEIKTAGAVPMWLSAALSKCEIFSAPFSKYGTAYKKLNFPYKGEKL